MSIAFTKDEKKYFEFLIDMGFTYDSKTSDKHNLYYEHNFDGDNQFVLISKDGFVGNWMNRQIIDYEMTLEICTSRIGSIDECRFPQWFDHYKTDEEKMVILEKYKRLIVDTFEEFEKHDHITGNMNEYIYNNYENIAKSTNFVPKTMDELNEYAIKLRDKGKASFKDYIYIIASLMIVFLINNTDINNLYLAKGKNVYSKVLGVFLKPYPEKPIFGFGVTILVKKLWDKKIDDLFHENREYLDNYFKQKEIKGI